MDPIINLPPLPGPVRHDWQWFRTLSLTYWTPLDTKERCIYPSAILVVLITLLSQGWRFFRGSICYWGEYIATACGHDMLTESCAGIMKEPHPWWNLPNSEYYRWMRCVGNDRGFQRQGELLPSFGHVLNLVLQPFGVSLWIVSVLTYLLLLDSVSGLTSARRSLRCSSSFIGYSLGRGRW
jgi:hypothetical protein